MYLKLPTYHPWAMSITLWISTGGMGGWRVIAQDLDFNGIGAIIILEVVISLARTFSKNGGVCFGGGQCLRTSWQSTKREKVIHSPIHATDFTLTTYLESASNCIPTTKLWAYFAVRYGSGANNNSNAMPSTIALRSINYQQSVKMTNDTSVPMQQPPEMSYYHESRKT